MPDRQVLKSRTESHSDVANTPAARARQAALTEREFGAILLRHLREAKGEMRLDNLQEEWISTEDGLVHELQVGATAEAGE